MLTKPNLSQTKISKSILVEFQKFAILRAACGNVRISRWNAIEIHRILKKKMMNTSNDFVPLFYHATIVKFQRNNLLQSYETPRLIMI